MSTSTSTRARVARSAAAGVLATTVVAALAGCGEATGAGAAAQATAQTLAAPPADLGLEQLLDRTTAAQREAGTVTVALEVAGADAADVGLSEAHAVLDLSTDLPQMAMTASTSEGDVELRTVAGSVYLLLPDRAGLSTGGRWLVIDPTAHDEASRQLGALADQLGQSAAPELVADELVAADVVTMSAGPADEIDGVPTRRYDFSLDVAAAADALPDAELAEHLRAAAAAGLDVIEQSLWLDGDYLPRRTEGELPADPDTPRTATLVGTFSGWGEPVTIEAPPADQTVTVADLVTTERDS